MKYAEYLPRFGTAEEILETEIAIPNGNLDNEEYLSKNEKRFLATIPLSIRQRLTFFYIYLSDHQGNFGLNSGEDMTLSNKEFWDLVKNNIIMTKSKFSDISRFHTTNTYSFDKIVFLHSMFRKYIDTMLIGIIVVPPMYFLVTRILTIIKYMVTEL